MNDFYNLSQDFFRNAKLMGSSNVVNETLSITSRTYDVEFIFDENMNLVNVISLFKC